MTVSIPASQKILLINPNTTQGVTDAVLRAARTAAWPGTELTAVTGTFGPEVIGSRAENALAQHGVLQLVADHAKGHDAVVLGVSLDTGLWACRELLSIPVIGMTEAGLLMGCNVAARIGVLTYGRRMGPLYRELVEQHGLASRLAEIVTLEVTPQDTIKDPEHVKAQIVLGCQSLVREHGAEAVLLSGAAMASLARELQAQVEVPLIDGVACAVLMAQSQVVLGLPKARSGSVSPTGGRPVNGVSDSLASLFAGRL